MADDYFDGKKIDQILESRRRDPLNEAIDERDNRVQSALQQGNFVDTRDKEWHQYVEELKELKEKMEIIQEMKANTDGSSQIQAPHIMSTEELMANQMNLQQLQQQLNSEYHELNSSLQGRSR